MRNHTKVLIARVLDRILSLPDDSLEKKEFRSSLDYWLSIYTNSDTREFLIILGDTSQKNNLNLSMIKYLTEEDELIEFFLALV